MPSSQLCKQLHVIAFQLPHLGPSRIELSHPENQRESDGMDLKFPSKRLNVVEETSKMQPRYLQCPPWAQGARDAHSARQDGPGTLEFSSAQPREGFPLA